jgi:hypothetical protein
MCKSCGCGCSKPNCKGACKKADKKQDAKVKRGMTPAQKKKFDAADKKMDAKNPPRGKDKEMDEALADKIEGKKKKAPAKKKK